jgi:DNA polymerase I
MKLLRADTVRRCFIARPGRVIISADFDQIELRVAAALAREQSLIDAARRGDSLHKVAAVKLFGEDYTPDQYRYTKNVNFGWLYGGGARTLSEQAGIPFEVAQSIIADYTKQFPALTAYKRLQTKRVIESALNPHERQVYRQLLSRLFEFRGDTPEGRRARAAVQKEMDRLSWGKLGHVVTPSGRRLVVEASKAYKATNYVVQSYSRDVMAQALLDVMDDEELEPTVLLPIHDEILGEAPRSKAEHFAQRYGEVMSRDFEGVPLAASGKVYGKSWGHGYRK